MTLDWALADAVDALLDLAPEARAQRLAEIAASDPERAAALRTWLQQIDASEGRLEPLAAPGGTGPWRALQRVGQGGMGEVWRGERADGAFARTVAIKFLRHDRSAASEHLRRERELLARLRHPGIAALLDAGIAADGRPYLVTEWVDGERLDHWLARRQPPLRQRVALAHALALAVAEAHSQLVIHRDLKPANVMVDTSEAPRLLDFGIARALDHAAAALQTRDGALTPAFAAPEQLRCAPISTRTDVYGLGGLLYVLLTGQGAHGEGDSSLAAVVERVCQQDAPPPSRLAADIDADLDAITLTALARDPARRYASADALAADLARWLRGEYVSARLPGRWERTRRFAARHWLPLTLASALLLALGAGWWSTERQRNRALQALSVAESERRTAQDELARSQSLRDALIASFRDADDQRYNANDWLDRLQAQARSMREPAARARLQAELAELESERSQPLRAAALYRAALTAAPQLEPALRARVECGLARALATQGADPEALAAYTRGVALAGTLQGSERLILVQCLNVAIGSDGSAPSAEAQPALERALQELDRLGESPRVQTVRASTLHSLGAAHDMAGEAEAAITRYQQALALDRALGQAESIASATTLGAVAGLEMQLSRFAEADRDYQQALALSERVGGRTQALATDLANHAGLKNTLGEHAAAAAQARRALAVLDAVAPGDNLTRGNAELELAKALERLQQGAEAVAAALRAERAFIAAFGADHDYVHYVAITRARIDALRGDAAGARARIESTLAHFRQRGAAGAVAACLSVASSLALARGDLDAADALARELVEIQRGRGQPEHWRVAAAEAEWAEVAAARGEHSAASALLDHAEPILRATFGPTHWRTQRAAALRKR